MNGDRHGTPGRGGRTLLMFSDDPARVQQAVDALALAVHEGALGKLTIERVDGEHILGSPLASALEAAGFHATHADCACADEFCACGWSNPV